MHLQRLDKGTLIRSTTAVFLSTWNLFLTTNQKYCILMQEFQQLYKGLFGIILMKQKCASSWIISPQSMFYLALTLK